MREAGERVLLIVDDEPEIVDALTHIAARSRGLIVAHAPSAEVAEGTLAARRVTALLTDIRMPGRSGIDLVQHARRMHPSVRCAIMTGYHEEVVDGVRLDDLGLVAVLRKPFRAQEARDLILRLVHGTAPTA